MTRGVDLHPGLTPLLQPRNDPSQAEPTATFSNTLVATNGSVFDARNGRFWLRFRCKSTVQVIRFGEFIRSARLNWIGIIGNGDTLTRRPHTA